MPLELHTRDVLDRRPRRPHPAAERQCLLGVCQLTLKLLLCLDQDRNACGYIVRRGLEQRGGFLQSVLARSQPVARGLAGQRLDTADARGNRAFRHDLEQRNVAERGDMGAAAEFDRI